MSEIRNRGITREREARLKAFAVALTDLCDKFLVDLEASRDSEATIDASDSDLERDDREAMFEVYCALERILRAGQNGHPYGHDAAALGVRALKRVGKLLGREPNLKCNCTPCAQARKDKANETHS
jgi:hypothetical protein